MTILRRAASLTVNASTGNRARKASSCFELRTSSVFDFEYRDLMASEDVTGDTASCSLPTWHNSFAACGKKARAAPHEK